MFSFVLPLNNGRFVQDDEEDFGAGRFVKYQKMMWDLIEKPDTSRAAQVISVLSTMSASTKPERRPGRGSDHTRLGASETAQAADSPSPHRLLPLKPLTHATPTSRCRRNDGIVTYPRQPGRHDGHGDGRV